MRRKLAIITVLVLSYSTFIAQTIDINLNDGFVARGYDLISYFDGKAQKGCSDYVSHYDGGKYLFSTVKNKATFDLNPEEIFHSMGAGVLMQWGSMEQRS